MLIILDFETLNTNSEGVDKHSCGVVQLAAIPLNDKTFEIHEDESFNIRCCPMVLNGDKRVLLKDLRAEEIKEFKKNYSRVLEFHSDIQGQSIDELFELWTESVPESEGIKRFCEWSKQFGKGRPFAAGHNVIDFDIPILQRLCKKYKIGFPFNNKETFDSRYMVLYDTKYAKNRPKDLKMDTFREHFKLEKRGAAHDALADVLECADLIMRLLRLNKRLMDAALTRIDEPQWKWSRALHNIE